MKNKNYDVRLNKLNSVLWCLIIYIQYMLMPIEHYFNVGFIKYIIVVVVFVISLIKNGIRKDFIRLFFSISLFFLLDYLVFGNIETISFFYISMFSSSLLMLFFTMNLKDMRLYFDVYYNMSLITLAAVVLYIFIADGDATKTVSYMAIGNVLSFISVSVSYRLYLTNDNKIKNHLLLMFLLVLSIFYANRMSIVTIFLIYQIPKFIFLKKDKLKLYIISLFQFSIFFIAFFNISTILNYIIQIIGSKSSYVLIKLNRMLSDPEGLIQGLINSSSGRDSLYDTALDIIRNSYGFPNGISGFNVVGDNGIVFYYPHNIFLELFIVFGIFSIPIFIYFMYRLFKKYKTSDEYLQFFILCFFVFSFSRALVSSSIWLSPSLWTCIGALYINSNKKNRKKL